MHALCRQPSRLSLCEYYDLYGLNATDDFLTENDEKLLSRSFFISPFSLSLHSGKRRRLCSCIITMHIGCSSPEKINQLRKDELSFAFFLFSIPGLHKRRTRKINRNSSHDICPMAAIPTDQLNLANKSLTSGGLFKWSPIPFLRTPVS